MACLRVSGDERSGCYRETRRVVGVLRCLPSDDGARITEQGQNGGVDGLGDGTVTWNLVQSGPKECIHSLLINIFGINLNEISISG